MIRRNFPLGETPTDWLLISQVEHARISHQLAAEWKDLLPGAPEPVRDELLAAILHHDDGWAPWERKPTLDPAEGRPYDFTEMPPAEAQAIWTRSIEACRAIGPLAGWVVTSHFMALQNKADDDYAVWRPWLTEQQERQAAWLDEWRDADERNTPELAEMCLYLLQIFDWLSLWLCCRAPVTAQEPIEDLKLGGHNKAFGAYHLTPDRHWPLQAESQRVAVAPWPFVDEIVNVTADAVAAPLYRYLSFKEVREEANPAACAWALHPKRSPQE